MRISIFSKFDMAGGSEFRCIELAHGLSRFTKHDIYLLAENKFPERLKQLAHMEKKVGIVEDCFSFPQIFYDSDIILVVNTDVREFSTIDYWQGKSARHNFSLNIDKLKKVKFYFLYNFIVSPSRHLYQLSSLGIDVSIITTNRKFFDEITNQDRYENIRLLRRYILESPIDNRKIYSHERLSGKKVHFGMHSKALGNKWNNELEKLIIELNERYSKEQIAFYFMGMKKDLRKKVEDIENVTCLDEDEESISDFLLKLDVFLFFPEWKREEPWARVIAEAMISGCPAIVLDKGGTRDQVLHGNSGFLCKKYRDYYNSIVYLVEHKKVIEEMSRNSLRISREFYTERVIEKLMHIFSDNRGF